MRTHRPLRVAGFTLFEVLVALAILALALSAVTRATLAASDAAGEYKHRQLARWVAENQVAAHQAIERFPPNGVAEGTTVQAGVPFVWRETTTQTPNINIRKLDIEVRREGESHVLARHVAFLSPR